MAIGFSKFLLTRIFVVLSQEECLMSYVGSSIFQKMHCCVKNLQAQKAVFIKKISTVLDLYFYCLRITYIEVLHYGK